MQLRFARIKHFRSLRDIWISFGAHTAFIGGNGAGKSSILRALYSTARVLDKDDFFGRDQQQPIEIELTFGNLNEEELENFERRVRNDQLVVTRIFDTGSTSGRYYGSVPQNRDFLNIRNQSNASAKRDAYRELRNNNDKYADLPIAGSAAAVETSLSDWEAAHPEELTLERDDGQFFGFQNAGRGALQRHTSFVFVPAVREAAADALDGKTSPIGRLLEIVVRSSILKRSEVQKFQQEIAERYREIVSPNNMPELGLLASDLTRDLKELYSSATVGLEWRETGEIPIPLPAADVTLSDDGFGGPVDRQGHGLQRAFVFTLLQHLARASVHIPRDASGEPGLAIAHPIAPDLILAVEEPELYQHPTKQRHLAQTLRKLSASALPGAAGITQIAFASHSPVFVSLAHPDEIRLVRRVDCDDSNFKQCDLRSLELPQVARKLERALGKIEGSFTAETLKPRLHILGIELSEGFFADGVVLVEGRSDKAALFAAARILGASFESAGIAVLPVEGKNNLDRPYLIFKELGIPVYVVWDCDYGTRDHRSSVNLGLNRLVRPDQLIDFPCETTLIETDHAHFAVTLENFIKDEISQRDYDSALSAACGSFGFHPSGDAQKSPDVMHALLSHAAQNGKICKTLESLVKAIWLHLKGKELDAVEREAL